MLMASDNMQFTVQASAMMSMHYIYVRPTEFKAFFCSTKSTDRNAFSENGLVTFSTRLITNFGANDEIGTIFLRFEI